MRKLNCPQRVAREECAVLNSVETAADDRPGIASQAARPQVWKLVVSDLDRKDSRVADTISTWKIGEGSRVKSVLEKSTIYSHLLHYGLDAVCNPLNAACVCVLRM